MLTRVQADVSDVAGKFQRQAGAASSLRHLPGYRTCRQQAIQVRLSSVVVDRRWQGWSSTCSAALPSPRLAVQRRPAGLENRRLVREAQTHQQYRRQERTSKPNFCVIVICRISFIRSLHFAASQQGTVIAMVAARALIVCIHLFDVCEHDFCK